MIVNTDTLNVRSGPGTEYNAVNRLTQGDKVNVLESQPGGGPWRYVSWFRNPFALTGWVNGLFLRDDVAAPTAKPAAVPKWRTAKSLQKLLDQVNALAPNRNKKYDGTIGDTAHASRKSDHNPNVAGVVTALDITHDPTHGVDCGVLSLMLVGSRDSRIKYVIYNGRICSSVKQPWEWRTYTGPNSHAHHLHVSVDADPKRYDDETPWKVAG